MTEASVSLKALTTVARGGLRLYQQKQGRGSDDMALLTKRECEVAELISRGLSLKEIAARLCCSRRTVDSHATNIREKWKVHNAAALTRRYVEWELLKKEIE